MLRSIWRSAAVVCFAAAAAAQAGEPIQVVLTPAKDNTLYEDESGALSNGAGEFLFAGQTEAGVKRRALLQFDLASEVPAGSEITDVSLELTVSQTRFSTERSVSLHPALQDWGEGASDAEGDETSGAPAATGDATWLHTFFDTEFWDEAGGDFVIGSSGTVQVGGVGDYTWSTIDMIADVQGWVDDPASNFGWLVQGDETADTTAKGINSREHSQTANRPELTVTFIPPATEGEGAPAEGEGGPEGQPEGLPMEGEGDGMPPEGEPVEGEGAGLPVEGEGEGRPEPVGTVMLTPSKDNTLYEDDQGDVSNGSGSFFFAGVTGQPRIRRGLIAFDIAGNVPAGAEITGVTLRLTMSRTISGATGVALHPSLVDWGEGASDAGGNEGAGAPAATGDATWLHTFFDTRFWTFTGGQFEMTPSAVTPVDDEGSYTWSSEAMIDDVQSWLDDADSNFGWFVLGDESTSFTAKRFNSRENGDAESRPVLIVQFGGGGEGEGQPEGEGEPGGEPQPEGEAEPDGEPQPEGEAEPEGEPQPEGEAEPGGEPQPEGEAEPGGEPQPEGEAEPGGEPQPEGEAEGVPEGEGPAVHTGDLDGDNIIELSDLLRVIQLYNAGGYACAPSPDATADGFVAEPFAGPGPDPDCPPHSSDFAPEDGVISLSELLRAIQLFTFGNYFACPGAGTEDGFCPGMP